MIKNSYLNLDDVRDELIGKKFKIADIEAKGKAIYLEDQDGRLYIIDTTFKDEVKIIALDTDGEKLEKLEMKFDTLLRKLNIDEDELEKEMIDRMLGAE